MLFHLDVTQNIHSAVKSFHQLDLSPAWEISLAVQISCNACPNASLGRFQAESHFEFVWGVVALTTQCCYGDENSPTENIRSLIAIRNRLFAMPFPLIPLLAGLVAGTANAKADAKKKKRAAAKKGAATRNANAAKKTRNR